MDKDRPRGWISVPGTCLLLLMVALVTSGCLAPTPAPVPTATPPPTGPPGSPPSSTLPPTQPPGHPEETPIPPTAALLPTGAPPSPTRASASPNACTRTSFGSMLVQAAAGAWISPADVLIQANDELGLKGLALAGAPSDQVRDEWFARLPGWTRGFMRGSYESLQNIHQAATMFGMADMYECLAYGPESMHQAGEEALAPEEWVPRAEALAAEAGKCLIYGPAVQDYERMAGERGLADAAPIVAEVAPHVDIWMIQLARYQNWVDRGRSETGGAYTLADFEAWIAGWVSWIKGANPDARVWTQLGIGRWDPLAQACTPPQPPEYLLDYYSALARAGVDGVSVMPAQPCMPCPQSAPAGFICSDDPQNNEYYQQSLATFRQAIELACAGTAPAAHTPAPTAPGTTTATPAASQPADHVPITHGEWTNCTTSRMGASLMALSQFDDSTAPELEALAADGITGLAATLTYDLAAASFPDLPGWDRAQLCNSHECLRTRAGRAVAEGLAYEYLGYGPERLGGVPADEQNDLPWAVEVARDIADEWQKPLILSFSTGQLHAEAEERGYGWDNAGQVVALLAPYADVWIIQAADEYNNPNSSPDHPGPILSQRHFPPGPGWRAEVEKWAAWVRYANPEAEVWIQLALHRIPGGAPPWPDTTPSAELLLEYREWLVNPDYGPPLVDGVFISSVYSWPVDAALADAELERAIRLVCGAGEQAAATPTSRAVTTPAPVPSLPPTPASGAITLIEEGWTDDLKVAGITPVPGYYYRLYENSRYPCGAEGNHQFLVLDRSPDEAGRKHLFVKFLGGAAGFWYEDAQGRRAYYPQPNAVGLLNEALNRNWMFRASVSQEHAGGVTRRFRENEDFRLLVPSYCSHDFYHGTGECDETDGFCRYGHLAANEAVDYVQARFDTDRLIVYGGSAGAAGFYVGIAQDNVAGIIMDSQALDLSAIRDACLAGYDAFGGSFPCFCPTGGATCMEGLAARIGFEMGIDEPYQMVARGAVDTPLFLIWNAHDASRNAHYQYDNLHAAIRRYNPGGASVACRVCLPHSDPSLPDSCIADDTYDPIGACNLHVPTGSDEPFAQELVDDVYHWALDRLEP